MNKIKSAYTIIYSQDEYENIHDSESFNTFNISFWSYEDIIEKFSYGCLLALTADSYIDSHSANVGIYVVDTKEEISNWVDMDVYLELSPDEFIDSVDDIKSLGYTRK